MANPHACVGGCVIPVLVLTECIILVLKLVKMCHEGPHALQARHFSLKVCHARSCTLKVHCFGSKVCHFSP